MKVFDVIASATAVVSFTAVLTAGQRPAVVSGAVGTGRYADDQLLPPTPFEFAYSSEDVEGTHSAQQSGDAAGRISGSYTMTLADGRTRTVTYVADENGYRAEVNTNELGTESKNPADVVVTSSAITGEQAALQYGAPAPERPVVAGGAAGGFVVAGRRPQAAALAQGQQNRLALPKYGTFAGSNSAASASSASASSSSSSAAASSSRRRR